MRDKKDGKRGRNTEGDREKKNGRWNKGVRGG